MWNEIADRATNHIQKPLLYAGVFVYYTTCMKREIYIIANNIRSRHNVGAIFRSADAFGIKKIYLCGITPQPDHQRVEKVSLGAEKTVAWGYIKRAADIVKKLKKDGVQIVALEKNSTSRPIQSVKLKSKVVIILGNEVYGVRGALLKQADIVVHIPMLGHKESLNVSVAAGIAMFSVCS